MRRNSSVQREKHSPRFTPQINIFIPGVAITRASHLLQRDPSQSPSENGIRRDKADLHAIQWRNSTTSKMQSASFIPKAVKSALSYQEKRFQHPGQSSVARFSICPVPTSCRRRLDQASGICYLRRSTKMLDRSRHRKSLRPADSNSSRGFCNKAASPNLENRYCPAFE